MKIKGLICKKFIMDDKILQNVDKVNKEVREKEIKNEKKV